MTTETILTDKQIDKIRESIPTGVTLAYFARAIEQAVLQSDPIQSMQGMADCMAMVRQEFIEAGVINESVPPMMVANAVLAEIQALRKDAERYRFCRSQTSPAEIHIYGVELGLADDELDAAVDEEMKEWRS